MECLSNQQIQDYIEKNGSFVERSIIRDHLIVCEKCQLRYKQYLQMENILTDPEYVVPPERIEKNVMKKIYSRFPAYSSLLSLIAASFVLLVSWIYIYFDFANNSLIQALKMTSDNTSSWIASVIKIISTIFSSVYAIYKTVSKFFDILFNINIGIEIFSLSILILTLILFYAIYQLVFKPSRRQKI
ncbi:MAG: hypothetical protein KAT17_04465 [Candidatus Aminicenantes bacterium]|nr:hypothetical protein [Candidatus Aminicenantes bacterium]